MIRLQLNKREIKQPAKFSKPQVRTNYHTHKNTKKPFQVVHGMNGLQFFL